MIEYMTSVIYRDVADVPHSIGRIEDLWAALAPAAQPHGDPLTEALNLAEARDHCDKCRAYSAETERFRQQIALASRPMAEVRALLAPIGWEPSGLPTPLHR